MSQDIFEIGIEVERSPDNALYHYTSHASLIKIIESGKLYATGIRYLNDSTEFRYTEDIFVKSIDQRIEHFDEKSKDFFLYLRKNLAGENELRSAAYVSCFTEEKDLLGQWRAYCPPGAGFSIGFSPKPINEATKNQEFDLVKCIYDVSKQNEAVWNVLDHIEKEFLAGSDDEIADDIKFVNKNDITEKVLQMWGKVVKTIQHLAPIFKHPAFSEEREWRAVSREFSVFNTEASWRPGKNIPIPYITFNLPETDGKKEISEVIIGPTPNTNLSSITVARLIKGKGYTCFKFTKSNVPYREW